MSQTRRVFVSYARENKEFAQRLASDLKERGLSIWIDQQDIRPGEQWDRAIQKALASSPSFLVILSPEAVESSNVMDEVSYALDEAKVTIPVLHRPCEIPYRLRRLQRVDFSASYETALTRLAEALATVGAAEPAPRHEHWAENHGDGTARRVGSPEDLNGADAVDVTARSREAWTNGARRRLMGAGLGAALGAAIGALSGFLAYMNDARIGQSIPLWQPLAAYAAVCAVSGAITGMIAGPVARALPPILGAILVVVLVWMVVGGTYADVVMTGVALGGGAAAIITAIVWTRMQRRPFRSDRTD